jgi:hypothetical protein
MEMTPLGYSRNLPPLMETEGSLLCSQELPLGLNLGQMNPVHTLIFYSFMINFNIILLDIPSGLVPSGFSNILNK